MESCATPTTVRLASRRLRLVARNGSHRSTARVPHRQAVTAQAHALRELPALDRALGNGELTLDQVAAVTPFATPETDAEIARTASAKRRREIAARRTPAHPADGRRRPGDLPATRAEDGLER